MGYNSKDIPPSTRIGFLTVLGKVRTPPGASGGQRYRLECVCGARITKPRFYLVRENPLQHCGCKAPKQDFPLTYTKRSWQMMHVRCEFPRHVAFRYYGGRGIKVCERWHKTNPEGFDNFVKDMGLRPQGLSLDRIDPDGNYEPVHSITGEPQCRWATKTTQSRNQSKFKGKDWTKS